MFPWDSVVVHDTLLSAAAFARDHSEEEDIDDEGAANADETASSSVEVDCSVNSNSV